MRFYVLILLLLTSKLITAQIAIDTTTIDISAITESRSIINKCQLYIDSNNIDKPNFIVDKTWLSLNNFNITKAISNNWITKPIYLKFTLENRSDTSKQVHLIVSNYIRSIQFYNLLNENTLAKIKNECSFSGYQPFYLKGHEKAVYIVKFYFTRRNLNYLQPQLIADNYLPKYQTLKYFKNDGQPAIGFVLSGILLMMIFFTGANYLHTKRKEFLYNFFYSLCMFALIFLNTLLERKSGLFSSIFQEYLDFMLLETGTIFYIAFTRKFLNTKLNYPLLNTIFVWAEKFLVGVLICFTITVFFTDLYELQKEIENVIKILMLGLGITYIGISIGKKNKLMNYLAVGNALLIFFSIISFLNLFFFYANKSIFNNAMLWYEVGIVSELIFFLLGLTYKNRVELIETIKEQESLKREAEKLSYETKLVVLNAQQTERNRISADMHDDLGAGVTAIRLYSELAKKRIGNEIIPELEKISSSANELLNNMNAIIWTMTSSNDTLANMVAYIRTYALEYFEETGIECNFNIEESFTTLVVSGVTRRNIFLVFKEALNNILKHSKATIVNITIKKDDKSITLNIQDNGIGIDFNNLKKFRNGLVNMKKRMDEMNIEFTIENKNGTLITLHKKLKSPVESNPNYQQHPTSY